MTIIKICGLTHLDDVKRVLDLRADWLGFIHVPKSPRYLNLEALDTLLKEARGAHRVVVVRNCEPDQLAHMREHLEFESFQFHGDEPPEYLTRFQGYRVFHMDGDADINEPPTTFGSPFLLDTSVRGQRGGTGTTFNWDVLPKVAGQFLVAGGLTDENVGQLIDQFHPWGVDVSSGVEASPGRKNHQKLQRFIENIRRQDS